MLADLDIFFGSAAFIPHAVCLLWRPDLLIMHGGSDLLIAIAYMTIPVQIISAMRRRPDLLDPQVGRLFAAFILFCALSHLVGLITLWVPLYGLHGLIKIATAAVSIYTAWTLYRLLPDFLSLPSRAEMAAKDAAILLKDRERETAAEIAAKLEQFAFVAAHDLRAPLRAMTVLPDWLRSEIESPEIDRASVAETLDMMTQQMGRLDALIVDLLAYARISDDDAAPEPVDLGAVVDDTIALLAPDPGHTITVEGTLPTLPLVRSRIELVLRNLLGNALKHHDRDTGTITVRAGPEQDGFAVIEIEDDGPGIPEDKRTAIFDTFVKLVSKDEVEGSGMGLAFVKRAVETAGGSITVSAARGDRGSLFTLRLPCRHPQTETA